jgi:hypothetical protein
MQPHDSTQIRSLGIGQSVDTNDQLSSVVILGIAVVGGLVALVVTALV